MAHRGSIRTGLLGAGLLCASVLLSLLAAEGVLRLVAPQPHSWLDIYSRHAALPFFGLQSGVSRHVDTGETRWSVYTDRESFRSPANPSEPSAAPLALVLGDSFAFGHGVNYEETFVHHLAEVFGDRFRFVNAGVGGHGPVQYRQTLEYLIERGHDPQLLLVAVFLGNDLHDCIWSKDIPVKDGVIGDRGGLRSALKRSSHLYRLLSAASHRFEGLGPRARYDVDELYREEAWREGRLRRAAEIFRAEFEHIAEIAQRHGAPLLVALVPTAKTVGSAAAEAPSGIAMQLDFGLPSQKVRAILNSLGVASLDLTGALAERGLEATYFRYDGHFTPLGHEIAARSLADGLTELIDRAPLSRSLALGAEARARSAGSSKLDAE